METLNQREKKDAVPAPFGTLFLPFWKSSVVPNRRQRPFLPGVNMEKGFTSQSDGLATTHQVPLRYLLRNGTAAFHRWSSGIPRNSYQVPWFGCLNKSVLGCFVKSFPNVGPYGTNERERT